MKAAGNWVMAQHLALGAVAGRNDAQGASWRSSEQQQLS